MPGHGYIPTEMPSKKTLSVEHGLCPAEYNTLWVQGQQPKCLVDWNVPTSSEPCAKACYRSLVTALATPIT